MRAGADWQPGGRRNAAGVMADNLLWYQLLGITPDWLFITLPKAIIYTLDVEVENNLFTFLSIHIPIYYLFTIIPTDYSNISKTDFPITRNTKSHNLR